MGWPNLAAKAVGSMRVIPVELGGGVVAGRIEGHVGRIEKQEVNTTAVGREREKEK